jgi:hypothetical protein
MKHSIRGTIPAASSGEFQVKDLRPEKMEQDANRLSDFTGKCYSGSTDRKTPIPGCALPKLAPFRFPPLFTGYSGNLGHMSHLESFPAPVEKNNK